MGVIKRYLFNNPKALEGFAKQLRIENWANNRIRFAKLPIRQVAIHVLIIDAMPVTKHDIEVAKLYLKEIDCQVYESVVRRGFDSLMLHIPHLGQLQSNTRKRTRIFDRVLPCAKFLNL